MEESILLEEIEALESIYIHELEVQRNKSDVPDQIVLQLHPATGDDVDQQFVCMTLRLDIPDHYPEDPPDIAIKNPRGIGEEEVQSLIEDMHSLSLERIGGPMLYELIELAKDSLTAGNIPHCPCMICLEHFHEGENFTKTECYHYFHHSCLSRYIRHVLSTTPKIEEAYSRHTTTNAAGNLICPVCREEIQDQSAELQETDEQDDVEFTPSKELRKMQADMAQMYEKQKAKGGIIDIEAERNKYLVKKDDVVLLAPTGNDLIPPVCEDDESVRSGADRGSSGKGNRDQQQPRDNSARYSRNSRGYRENRRPGSAAGSADNRPGSSRESKGKDKKYDYRDKEHSRFTRGKGRGNGIGDWSDSHTEERKYSGRNREGRDKQTEGDTYRDRPRDDRDKQTEGDKYRDRPRDDRDKQTEEDKYRDRPRDDRDKQIEGDKYKDSPRNNRDKQTEGDKYRYNSKDNQEKQAEGDKRYKKGWGASRDRPRDKQTKGDKYRGSPRDNRDNQSRGGPRDDRGYRGRHSDTHAKHDDRTTTSVDSTVKSDEKKSYREKCNDSGRPEESGVHRATDSSSKPVIKDSCDSRSESNVRQDKSRTETDNTGQRKAGWSGRSDTGYRPDSHHSGRYSDRQENRYYNRRNRGRDFTDKDKSSLSPRNKPEYGNSKSNHFQASDDTSDKECDKSLSIDNQGRDEVPVKGKPYGREDTRSVSVRTEDESRVESRLALNTGDSNRGRGNVYRHGRGRGRAKPRNTEGQKDKTSHAGYDSSSRAPHVENGIDNCKNISTCGKKSDKICDTVSDKTEVTTASVSEKTNGPPGFKTRPPPGFHRDSAPSIVKPPPGF